MHPVSAVLVLRPGHASADIFGTPEVTMLVFLHGVICCRCPPLFEIQFCLSGRKGYVTSASASGLRATCTCECRPTNFSPSHRCILMIAEPTPCAPRVSVVLPSAPLRNNSPASDRSGSAGQHSGLSDSRSGRFAVSFSPLSLPDCLSAYRARPANFYVRRPLTSGDLAVGPPHGARNGPHPGAVVSESVSECKDRPPNPLRSVRMYLYFTYMYILPPNPRESVRSVRIRKNPVHNAPRMFLISFFLTNYLISWS